MKTRISVVIPNYNGQHLLETNLPHLLIALQNSKLSDSEIIIPDDASTDRSIEFLRQHYPTVICVPGNQNLGFSGNTNRGIRRASHDLVLLLNSDVQLTPDYFQSLLEYFEEPDTFGVSGRIDSLDQTQIQDAAKYPSRYYGSIKGTLNYTVESEPFPRKILTFFMSGANALVDRKKLIELGGFDEIFSPYYAEDVDLSLRAWRLGYRCYYEPRAICLHPNSATIGQLPSTKVRTVARRNQFLLHDIHLEGWERKWFQAWVSIKAYIRRATGDSIFWSAFLEYKKLKKAAEASKHRLAQLQTQKGSLHRDIPWIQRTILESLKRRKISLF